MRSMENKRTIAVLAAIVIILLVVILVTMNRGGGVTADVIAGNYEIESLDGRGETSFGTEELETMKESGITIYLTLMEDGTGIMDIFGEVSEVSFDTESMTMEIDGTQEPFTYEDGTLTVERSGTAMVFKRE